MSTQTISIALQEVAATINDALESVAGEPVAFVLVLQHGGVAQYVSNAARADGSAMIESLLSRWKAGRADIPAHYNPDLGPKAGAEVGIVWRSIAEEMPDADETVLIFHPAENEPVWMGYYDGVRWVAVDGMPIGTVVSHWAPMPEIPRT